MLYFIPLEENPVFFAVFFESLLCYFGVPAAEIAGLRFVVVTYNALVVRAIKRR